MTVAPAFIRPGPIAIAGLLAASVAFAAVALSLTALPVRAVVPTKGDVYVGIGNGRVAHYSNTGVLIETLNSTTGAGATTGMCFDGAGNLYSTDFTANTISKYSPSGALLASHFGSGYNASPESCVLNAAGQFYIGQADGLHTVRKLDAAGNLLASYSPNVTGGRGTDWIDLAADQCTLYYTGENAVVKRFNVCTNTQLSAFVTAPSPFCFAHRLRLNGELILACSNAVYRYSAAGTLLHTYPGASFSPATTDLFALNLDPDNATFWTAAETAHQIYRINIATGAQVSTFNAASSGTVDGLAIAGEIVVAGPSPSPSPSSTPAPTPALPAPPATGRR
jgi:sugar lactone lactonase YvrE